MRNELGDEAKIVRPPFRSLADKSKEQLRLPVGIWKCDHLVSID